MLKWQLYPIINNNLNLHLNKMLECSLLGKMEDSLKKGNSTQLINRILNYLLLINLLFTNKIFSLKLSKVMSDSNPNTNKLLLSDKETPQQCILLILLRIPNNKFRSPLVTDTKYSNQLLLKEWWDNHKTFLNKKHSDFYDSSLFFTIKVLLIFDLILNILS